MNSVFARTHPPRHRRSAALLVTLLVFLASIYMLTYSGRIESGDSLQLFDATSSLVQFKDLLLDESAWFEPPAVFNLPADAFPLRTVDTLPLQPILAAPLYWLATRIPGIGLVHAVWLFNVIVSAATAGVLFLYALALGYRQTTALLAALALALATIIWPYSKSFFREPLLTLCILAAALALERWRAGHYRSFKLLAAGIIAMAGGLLTKESLIFAMPALAIIAIPAAGDRPRWKRLEILLLLLVGLFVVLASFVSWYLVFRGLGIRPPAVFFATYLPYFPTSLHGYLFSIGGSFWGTSPVTLLAVPGAWLLYQSGQRRYLWAAIWMVLAFALGHAVLRREHWFGGLSWPPRFLVPLIPFLIILALPVFDRLVRRPIPRGLILVSCLVLLYSVWVQLSAVTLWWGDYPGALPSESGQLMEWGGGLNQLQYLRWVIIPSLWDERPLDFAWIRAGAPAWALAFSALALISGLALWRMSLPGESSMTGRWARRAGVALPLLFLLAAGVGLRMIYRDDLYVGSNEALRALLPVLDAETHAGDVILLDSGLHQPGYERFFLNYYALDTARVVSLPPQPGERFAPDESPQVVSDNPDALLTNLTVPLIYALASRQERLWLVTDTGPFIAWNVRPVERFMASHYYPIRVITMDPIVRLIEYSTVDAPDPVGFRGPEYLTALVYGDALRLVGYTLPSGTSYTPGQALPISLYWQAQTPMDQNYTVAWFLADPSHTVVAQGADSQPGGEFAPTSQLQIGVPIWDNRALRLDIQPGQYRIWVKVYSVGSDNQAHDLPVTGETILDQTIGVLDTVIEVSSP